MCLLLVPVFQGFFFMRPLTVLMRQTRQAVRAIHQSILLRCLWALPAHIGQGWKGLPGTTTLAYLVNSTYLCFDPKWRYDSS
jgi:hypothetical protein